MWARILAPILDAADVFGRRAGGSVASAGPQARAAGPTPEPESPLEQIYARVAELKQSEEKLDGLRKLNQAQWEKAVRAKLRRGEEFAKGKELQLLEKVFNDIWRKQFVGGQQKFCRDRWGRMGKKLLENKRKARALLERDREGSGEKGTAAVESEADWSMDNSLSFFFARRRECGAAVVSR
eukprot:g14371.t1